ncbi:MAG TPA: hypothetical protein VFV78_10655 [Vicinamibacterales bacterium]|nr:hypothetical protein [Vicinamibacterales bacterium]
MTRLGVFLHDLPTLCLFLSLMLGGLIGRVHVRGVGFGSVVGTLIAGILIGILAAPELPDLLRWVFFYLFLFGVGYSVGPVFFGSLKKSALPQVVLAVVVALTGLATVISVVKLFGFTEGIAVGLLSGGMTQSAALGTGLSAINDLPISDEAKHALMADAPLGDAITYLFGDLGLILFLTSAGPKILRADLRADAKKLEQELSGGKPSGDVFTAVNYGLRAYRLDNVDTAASTLQALEQRFAAQRLTVIRVQRNGALVAIDPSLTLKRGDRLVVSARRSALFDATQTIGPEIDDPALLSVPMQTASVVVTTAEAAGATLEALAHHPRARGVYLESIQRGSEFIPHEAWTVLQRGDILRLVGAPDDITRAAAHVGFVERDLSKTDLTYLAGAICLGMLGGLITFNAGGVALGLGTSGSILVMGLVAGWARSRYPVFGLVPDAAQRLLMDIGLTVFIAIVGLHAGPHAVEAFHTSGAAYFGSILVAGMIVTIAPLAVGTIVARYWLKMGPLMTLGGLAGAQTCTPGLTALREVSGSNIGSMAYTVPYAVGNILLTLMGPIIVAIVHAMRG